MTIDKQLIYIIKNNGSCNGLYLKHKQSCDDCIFTDRCADDLNLSKYAWDQKLLDAVVLREASKLYLERNPGSEEIIFEALL